MQHCNIQNKLQYCQKKIGTKMGDPIKKPLHIPPWQIPYLEKHRIFELFHELARELVINKPDDHVTFLKDILYEAVRNRDTARVILLGPPKINCLEIAKSIAVVTKQNIITGAMVQECFQKCFNNQEMTPEQKAKCIAHCVRWHFSFEMGWILVDCISNAREAQSLLKLGIIPSHVLQFIPPFQLPYNELVYCHISSDWPDYRRKIIEIRSVFKHLLKEVFLLQYPLEEVIYECLKLLKIKPSILVIRPRIVILGPRGSGRKTQAKLLVENLNLVHVDFERLICEAWMDENELGKRVRMCKNELCYHSELLTEIIHERVLKKDCLENGWVLTGFPYTKLDFQHLDCIYTPPNRIILLDLDIGICRERLLHRRVNIDTGSITDIKLHPVDDKAKQLRIHPKDQPAVIDAELSFYCQQYGNIRRYCGNTANCINGDQAERWIYETILAIINRASPAVHPRRPFAHDGSDDALTFSSDSCCSVCPCEPIPDNIKENYKHTSKDKIENK